MNRRAVWAITRKDLRAIFANLQVWLPMMIVPLILGVVMPFLMVWAIGHFGLEGMNNAKSMLSLLEKIPSSVLKRALDAMPTQVHQVVYLMANYMLAPFFLIIPLMTSSVITADSFAGEKERGTLESLLFSPTDLRSLLLGKVLAAFLPSVGLSMVTVALSALFVNWAGWPLFHQFFFPQLNWVPLILLVIPMVSLTTILINIVISAKVATFQAAYQMGGFLVLPVIALLFGQVSGMLLLDTVILALIGVVLGLLNIGLFWLILRALDRSRLFESQVR